MPSELAELIKVASDPSELRKGFAQAAEKAKLKDSSLKLKSGTFDKYSLLGPESFPSAETWVELFLWVEGGKYRNLHTATYIRPFFS